MNLLYVLLDSVNAVILHILYSYESILTTMKQFCLQLTHTQSTILPCEII